MNNQWYGFGSPPSDVPAVPMPPGYRRAAPKEITKPVLKFAQTALQHALPVGKKQVATVTNPDKTQRLVMALTEIHKDNHPPRPKLGFKAYEGPNFLHPGISILVPDFKPKASKFNPFPTQVPGFPATSSENIYAGQPGRYLKGCEWNQEEILEAIFRRALQSVNPQAILQVAQGFRKLGQLGRAQMLVQRVLG
jgi:hypothetical protein